MGNVGQVEFRCSDCGSEMFVLPNDPPKDDDIISCAGCGKVIGRYDVVRAAAIKAGKTEFDKIIKNVFGKKPDWK